jgi:DNA-binding NarL/FixJ family response regulator
MIFNSILRNKSNILFGLCLALLLFLLKWLELRLLVINHAFEIYIGAIALLFTGLGIWLAYTLIKPKSVTIVVEKEIVKEPSPVFTLNENTLKEKGISKRELEVLSLIAQGLSNREIAAQLFVSENTIKTHTSRLFEKLEAEKRIQAVDRAKKLGLIP